MTRALLLLLLFIAPAIAQPTVNDRYVAILQIQRERAMTLAAQLEAQLVQVQEENVRLKTEIEEMKKK